MVNHQIDVEQFSYWIIVHKPSGKWLPNVPRQQSWQDPTFYLAPRLFEKRSSAATALGLWLKGKASVMTTTDWESGHTEDNGIDWALCPDRKRDEMAIVEVRMVKQP